MNRKLFFNYVGISLITLSISIFVLTVFPIDKLSAQDENEQEIKESELSKEFDLESYNDIISKSREMAVNCVTKENDDETDIFPKTIDDYISEYKNQQISCYQEASNLLNQYKQNEETKQILETHKMLNYYFDLINDTLEKTVEEAKETVKKRKEYVS